MSPRYVIYARKSTESEDRQVLSIDSQVKELKDFASRKGLATPAVLQESRSAKEPGRFVFNQLLKDINRGKLDGIVAWKLDRLARNPVDGAALIWALDQGHLQEITTPGMTYRNTANDKMMMQFDFGIAKRYVDDLSDNVKRGIRAKLEQGWYPNRPPFGYMNEPMKRTVVPDPERFPLVRKIWTEILRGEQPVRVLEQANEVWGIRTRQGKKIGGDLWPAVRSTAFSRTPSITGRCGMAEMSTQAHMIR